VALPIQGEVYPLFFCPPKSPSAWLLGLKAFVYEWVKQKK
jgi:hypothetical protein